MSRYEMSMPDVGEGVAEAEIVEWFVDVGDAVTPETVLAEVLTEKATIEVSSPVTGTVVERIGEPGDMIPVGGHFVSFDTDTDTGTDSGEDREDDAGDDEAGAAGSALAEPEPDDIVDAAEAGPIDSPETSDVERSERPPKVLAAPAVRSRASVLGIDLASVAGSGPDGLVTHHDLDRELTGGRAGFARRPQPQPVSPGAAADSVRVEPVRGVRRQIAQRLAAAWTEIPHITYVDAVDVTELDRLRSELNADPNPSPDQERLTLLPFIARAMVVALRDQPRLNAHHDHAAETLAVHDAVHIGIATQTDDGLRVPVVRHAEARRLRDLADEIARVTAAARDGTARRDELTGSTITITSLGALGGLVTTPILTAPEVAIVGVNKIETRPVWLDGAFVPRRVMNLSSSFDHGIVDGWDAATFVQRIRRLLETPALLFDGT